MVKVIHSVSLMDRGGQETFIMNLYRNINHELIQFDFQCSVQKVGVFDEEIRSYGGDILYLEDNHAKGKIFKYLTDIKNQYSFFKKHPNYDILHIHTYHAFDAWIAVVGARLAGVKKIIVHSHNTYGLHPTLHKLFRILLGKCKIERLACSIAAGDWLFGKSAMRKGQIKVIYNGIRPEDFAFDKVTREKKRTELGLENQLVVGHVGRFMRQKNHKFIVEIFHKIYLSRPDAKLLFIGDGQLRSEIEMLVKELNLEDAVIFLGVRTDVQELLNAMDVFLFPSLHEGLSVVAIEAQANGLPIVASDAMTVETKITNCLEFFSLNDDLEKWKQATIEAAEKGHCDTKKEIEEAGYDIRNVAREMEDIYIGR